MGDSSSSSGDSQSIGLPERAPWAAGVEARALGLLWALLLLLLLFVKEGSNRTFLMAGVAMALGLLSAVGSLLAVVLPGSIEEPLLLEEEEVAQASNVPPNCMLFTAGVPTPPQYC